MGLPKIIGHRGAKLSVAENTLESFVQAKEEGMNWIEIDTMLSKDNIAMVFHDEELDRMTGVKGRLDEKSAQELEKIKIEGDKKIPTLQETLELAKKLNLSVNVEIKPSCDEKALQTALEALKIVENSQLKADEILFSSFNWETLKIIKQKNKNYRIGLLVDEKSGDWNVTAQKLGAFSLNHDTNLITENDVKIAKKQGLKVLVYTVNDSVRAKELWSMGVDSIFSDCPGKILNES